MLNVCCMATQYHNAAQKFMDVCKLSEWFMFFLSFAEEFHVTFSWPCFPRHVWATQMCFVIIIFWFRKEKTFNKEKEMKVFTLNQNRNDNLRSGVHHLRTIILKSCEIRKETFRDVIYLLGRMLGGSYLTPYNFEN